MRLPKRLVRLGEWVTDIVWPTSFESFDAERAKERYVVELTKFRNSAKTVDSLEKFVALKAILEKWIDAERSRRASLESRLSALVGLSGGTTALLFGLLVNTSFKSHAEPVNAIFLILICYIVLQLTCAAVRGIQGMGPSPVDEFTANDLHPGSIDLPVFTASFVDRCQAVHYSYVRRNEDKATSLKCGYRALINVAFAGGGALMFLCISLLAC